MGQIFWTFSELCISDLFILFFIGYTVTDESLDETQCLANTSVFHHTHIYICIEKKCDD